MTIYVRAHADGVAVKRLVLKDNRVHDHNHKTCRFADSRKRRSAVRSERTADRAAALSGAGGQIGCLRRTMERGKSTAASVRRIGRRFSVDPPSHGANLIALAGLVAGVVGDGRSDAGATGSRSRSRVADVRREHKTLIDRCPIRPRRGNVRRADHWLGDDPI